MSTYQINIDRFNIMEDDFDQMFKIPVGRQAGESTKAKPFVPSGNQTVKKRVAVIGAGVSGLCAAKNLISEPDHFTIKVFERNPNVGGTWLYTDDRDVDKYGLPVHQCLYKNLRSNNSKLLMTLPGFPFNKEGRSYVGHEEVWQYLDDFCTYYDLHKYIQFDTVVDDVSPETDDNGVVTWLVTSFDVRDPTNCITERFDSVIVCNGHYSKPYVPEVKGIGDFKGQVFHSKSYREPDNFKGLNICILGASFSGQDISCDLVKVANKIFLSHLHDPLPQKLHTNIEEKPGVSYVTKRTVVFEDGTEENIDCFIYCTGYLYSFPFISDEILHVENKRITPLFKHMVHIKYNNLLFLGIPTTWTYFPLIYEQSRAAIAILKGAVNLPTEEEMTKDMENDFQHRLKERLPVNRAHFFGKGSLQWDYHESLTKMCGFKTLPKVFHKLVAVTAYRRSNEYTTFRNDEFRFINSEEFEEL